MNRRLLAACLVAIPTWSFAFAGASTPTGNPKTTQKSYVTPAVPISRSTQTVSNVVPIPAPVEVDEEVQTPAGAQKIAGSAKNQQPGTSQSKPVAAPGILGAAPGPEDDCTTPLVVVIGMTPFDLTLDTTGVEGQAEAICNTPAGTAILNDVWFNWTAPAAGYVSVSTCGLTLVDTKIAAYDGAGCPSASAIACRDDTCGTGQTNLVFPVSTAATYSIQLGCKPGFAPGPGTIDIEYVVPPSNDFCTTPQVLTIVSGANVIPFDNTNATTGPEGQDAGTFGCPDGGYGNYSDLWFEFTATWTGTADISTCGATGDTKLTVWTGSGCPAAAYLDCNNDAAACSPQSEILALSITNSMTYTIQLGSVQRLWLGASPLGGGHIMAPANMTIIAYATPSPIGTFCEPGVGGVMACPCTNPPAGGDQGCNNKDNTGGAQLTATGLPKLGEPLATSLVFTDTGQNFIGSQTSILLQGKVPTTGASFGHGVKCFGPFLRLYNHSTAPWVSGGIAVMPIAPDATIDVQSAAKSQPIPPGAPRYYQMFYRDNVNFLPAVTCSTPVSKQNISNGQWCYWTN